MIVLACRGCCCGTAKHPGVDHGSQLATLAEAAGRDSFAVTECLGHCRWSNVVVTVDPDTHQQTWFTKVLDPADTAAVAAWITDPSANPKPLHLVRGTPAPTPRA